MNPAPPVINARIVSQDSWKARMDAIDMLLTRSRRAADGSGSDNTASQAASARDTDRAGMRRRPADPAAEPDSGRAAAIPRPTGAGASAPSSAPWTTNRW